MIKPETKRKIIELWKKGVNKSEIAKRLNISRPTVRKYINNFVETQKKGFKLERLHDEDYKYSLFLDTLVKMNPKFDKYDVKLATGASPFLLDNILGGVFKEEVIYDIRNQILERGDRWQWGEKYIIFYNDEALLKPITDSSNSE